MSVLHLAPVPAVTPPVCPLHAVPWMPCAAVEVGDTVIPVQGKHLSVAHHSSSNFDLLCPPGLHITGIQGTKHPQLGITSICKVICNQTELSTGLPVGPSPGEEWHTAQHHALGFSGVQLALSREQLLSLTLQPVDGGSAEEIGARSTSTHSLDSIEELACPAGAVLAGLHGQVGARGLSNLGVVCRPRGEWHCWVVGRVLMNVISCAWALDALAVAKALLCRTVRFDQLRGTAAAALQGLKMQCGPRQLGWLWTTASTATCRGAGAWKSGRASKACSSGEARGLVGLADLCTLMACISSLWLLVPLDP